jgi:ABC-type sugar transport system permease subunit
MTTFEPEAPTTKPRKVSKIRLRNALTAFFYILPAIIVLFVFKLYPFGNAFYISLHRWGIIKESFVGAKHYITLFSDKAFWQSIVVTVFYVVATVPFTMALALFVAYLLFQKIKFRAVFRTLYFLPYITSMVPAAMAWQYIFNYQVGILNYVLKAIGTALGSALRFLASPPVGYIWALAAGAWLVYLLATARKRSVLATVGLGLVSAGLLALGAWFLWRPDTLGAVTTEMAEFFPVKWLQEPRGIFQYLGQRWGFDVPKWARGPSMALIAVSLVSVWHFLGYDVVIYLAGLGNVPSELYEAARIDGATEAQLFWKITLPLISPTSYFLALISTIGAFRAFTLFFIMTSGGPLKTTTTVAYFIFDRFWNAIRTGYASSAAFVLMAVILVLTFVQQRILARRITYQ